MKKMLAGLALWSLSLAGYLSNLFTGFVLTQAAENHPNIHLSIAIFSAFFLWSGGAILLIQSRKILDEKMNSASKAENLKSVFEMRENLFFPTLFTMLASLASFLTGT